jgi:hypothetical protein
VCSCVFIFLVLLRDGFPSVFVSYTWFFLVKSFVFMTNGSPILGKLKAKGRRNILPHWDNPRNGVKVIQSLRYMFVCKCFVFIQIVVLTREVNV